MNRQQRRTANRAPRHAVPRKIVLAICPDPAKPPTECTPAILISSLSLPRFEAAFGKPSPDGLGDCHEISLALMVDLYLARASDGWTLVSGVQNRIGEHSWLEHGEWAIDVACGKALVMDRDLYYSQTGARNITRETAVQVRARYAGEAA